MRVGVATEIKEDEYRVALAPASCASTPTRC
jgi:alanine dehydrogenase